jgi:hypothetical protein
MFSAQSKSQSSWVLTDCWRDLLSLIILMQPEELNHWHDPLEACPFPLGLGRPVMYHAWRLITRLLRVPVLQIAIFLLIKHYPCFLRGQLSTTLTTFQWLKTKF